MARSPALPRRLRSTLILLCMLGVANAQTYYFSGAVQVNGATCSTCGPGTGAVQAQCPAANPNRCDSIGASDYCCPAGNSCSWSNSQVACCPSGCTCSGWQAVGGYNGPVQSTSTYYQQPTTTYYTQPQATQAGGGVVVVTEQATSAYNQQQTTTQIVYGGNYCSTLTAKGPQVPTTAAGQCGTILVVPPSEAARQALGWVKLGATVVGFQALGALAFAGR
ncbi:hypothetical protein B0A55_08700 [Friedmanniomyces simplex]|uniref:Uncharacterized protein n=1 Tax=Friedmanniomyces simplex TaxID=329884 RepID=A0A4U0WQ78_9PEZI|nr:hypothetical protein B0A55_08700 [Friedmanniomyces simplex]